jgi:nicotinamide riboside kinase
LRYAATAEMMLVMIDTDAVAVTMYCSMLG